MTPERGVIACQRCSQPIIDTEANAHAHADDSLTWRSEGRGYHHGCCPVCFLDGPGDVGERVQVIEWGGGWVNEALLVPNGSTGKVSFVDGVGTRHVDWDNGSSLGLTLGNDRWRTLDASTDPVRDAENLQENLTRLTRQLATATLVLSSGGNASYLYLALPRLAKLCDRVISSLRAAQVDEFPATLSKGAHELLTQALGPQVPDDLSGLEG